MFVEMNCPCGAAFQMDAEDNDTAVWLMTYRFSNAHVGCGYIAAPQIEEPATARQVVRVTGEG